MSLEMVDVTDYNVTDVGFNALRRAEVTRERRLLIRDFIGAALLPNAKN